MSRHRGNAYGRIGYHYGRPGMYDDHEVITREDVRVQRLPFGWRPAARGGASNSWFYEPVNVIFADTVEANFVYDPLWTQGRYYRWLPGAEGGTLTFTVPVEEPGNYIVRFGLCPQQFLWPDNTSGERRGDRFRERWFPCGSVPPAPHFVAGLLDRSDDAGWPVSHVDASI